MARTERSLGQRGGALVRCAVYTRKSSEEGLEQDFNSLHAQREACEAYIKSQKHEGWAVLTAQYDDGGISGATMERPALQQLLADIRAQKIDTVVVYKVDRLTRSLADFPKIVEIFDGQGVAFVSVTLAEDLANAGITSKSWLSSSGRLWGGRALGRGALYLMLQNRIYRGDIVHKGDHYPGQHAAIVDQALWDQVQARMADNAADRRVGRAARAPSLLAGLIFDGRGDRMSPTHVVKAGKRYRYYISRALVTGARAQGIVGCRIPAAEVEQVVTDRVRALLADGAAVFDAISTTAASTERCGELVAQAAALAQAWPTLPTHHQRRFVSSLIARIDVRDDRLDLHVVLPGLAALLETDGTVHPSRGTTAEPTSEPVLLSVPAKLQWTGRGHRLIVNAGAQDTARPNASLIQLLARAHRLQHLLLQQDGLSIAALAKRANLSRTYLTLLLRLSWLAPSITEAILPGHQPPALTADKLSRTTGIPIDWPTQNALLGFS